MGFLLTPQQIGRRKVGFVASGGIEETYTSGGIDYKSHTFLSSGTFTVLSGEGIVDRLIIAGGGGSLTGGGGAGGYIFVGGPLQIAQIASVVGTYAVTIGAGGAGGRRQPDATPVTGANSSLVMPWITSPSVSGSTLTTTGGGHGGYSHNTAFQAGTGGSGGGGQNAIGFLAGGDHTTNANGSLEGSEGGSGAEQSEAGAGGGGGGKGAAGQNATTGNLGGNGGAGINNVYRTGSDIGYAGGGGGAGDAPGNALGGDANGGEASHGGGAGRSNGQNGTANTGGGAGGVCNFFGTPGNGGSGIVIIRYDSSQ